MVITVYIREYLCLDKMIQVLIQKDWQQWNLIEVVQFLKLYFEFQLYLHFIRFHVI